MNAQQEAVALFKFLESRGFRPSTRSVSRALRDQGMTFREERLRLWLKPFRDASGTHRAEKGTQKTSTRDAASTAADATGTRLRARDKVSLVSGDSVSSSLHSSDTVQPAIAGLHLAEPRKNRRRAEPDRSWIASLERELEPLLDQDLDHVTPAARLVVMRVFALRYANFSAHEGRNRDEGMRLAPQLLALVEKELRAGRAVGVRDYLRDAEKAWHLNGERPLRTAWAVLAVSAVVA
jgi:hypothetical protein